MLLSVVPAFPQPLASSRRGQMTTNAALNSCSFPESLDDSEMEQTATCYDPDKNLESIMADPHQVISIMATAICDARKDPDHRMDPEEAKHIAKCIVEALTDAGLQIVPVGKN
jgi:hypothetical protein